MARAYRRKDERSATVGGLSGPELAEDGAFAAFEIAPWGLEGRNRHAAVDATFGALDQAGPEAGR
jgi:hypothetical protein